MVNNARPMRTQDFDFELPQALIAQHPAPVRSDSRLLHVGSGLADGSVRDLPGLLRRGDLLVFNDTRVIRARLVGRKSTGGRAEVLVERLLSDDEMLAMVSGSKRLRPGSRIHLAGECSLEVIDKRPPFLHLRVLGPQGAAELLETQGSLPLPPYIQHAPGADDESRYQTVYAKAPGAVAAPTAGLHFDAALLQSLSEHGIAQAMLTLHVGAGTFRPVQVEQVRDHQMHSERYEISPELEDRIRQTRAAGGRIVAVGTTTVRALESAAREFGEVRAHAGETDIFITPGFEFRVVDVLMTNFHLPRSTLLMLVSAFGGTERLRAAYAHAVAQRYRFFSYGDAMLIERANAP